MWLSSSVSSCLPWIINLFCFIRNTALQSKCTYMFVSCVDVDYSFVQYICKLIIKSNQGTADRPQTGIPIQSFKPASGSKLFPCGTLTQCRVESPKTESYIVNLCTWLPWTPEIDQRFPILKPIYGIKSFSSGVRGSSLLGEYYKDGGVVNAWTINHFYSVEYCANCHSLLRRVLNVTSIGSTQTEIC